MRSFSIEKIINGATESVQRFPVIILLSIIGTSAAVWYAGLSFNEEQDHWFVLNLIVGLSLSVSLLLALTTYTEKRSWTKQSSLFLQLGGVIVIVLYIFSLPDLTKNAPEIYFIRHILLFISFHLAVSLAPFLNGGEINAFWQYNKSLFLKILISAFYSAALFIGLSIALLAVDNLLGFEVKGERYLQLWITMVGLFNTWFFLAGVPSEFGKLESVTEYPKGLRIFSQYVLIPLVTIYILILYAYTTKIIVEWAWPNGWVANLVLSFSLVGILSILLLHPLKDNSEHSWIRTFSKSFYYSLIPLVVLLMLSIYVRVSEYGITENRFFVATLAVWLTFIVVYFILSKQKNIKVIPLSLLIVMLGISFGPLSAFNVSKRNQLNRLEAKLGQYNILKNGFVERAHDQVPFEDARQISSIVSYLVNTHGNESLQPFFSESLDTLASDSSRFSNKAELITKLMGVDFVTQWDTEAAFSPIDFEITRADDSDAIQTKGYDWYYKASYGAQWKNSKTLKVDGREFKLEFDGADQTFSLHEGAREIKTVSLPTFIDQVLAGQNTNNNEVRLDSSLLEIEESAGNVDFKISFSKIHIRDIQTKAVDRFVVDIFMKFR